MTDYEESQLSEQIHDMLNKLLSCSKPTLAFAMRNLKCLSCPRAFKTVSLVNEVFGTTVKNSRMLHEI